MDECLYYSSSTACSCCNEGFSLVDNECVVPDNIKENCLCQVGGTCLICKPEFFEVDGVCVAKKGEWDFSCPVRSQLSDAVCVQCESGY